MKKLFKRRPKTGFQTRRESDSLGDLEVPLEALYGIQSLRATRNFPISGGQVHHELLRAYLLVKKAAAQANLACRALDKRRAQAIIAAVDSLLDGDFRRHFIVDAYQAGAGTSQNMNANEVIANVANRLLGKPLGTYSPVHPNDHVNRSQSSNDTYPTAMRLAALTLSKRLTLELDQLASSLRAKAQDFASVMKSGRTHLQDAVPISLGQEFAAYATVVERTATLVLDAQDALRVLGLGGSAAGTGLNVPPGYRTAVQKTLREAFHDPGLTIDLDLCAAMQSQLPMMIYSNALRATALELTRIMNDLRLLSSGPANGLGEIRLPAVQPGSSIMPGKTNPSICEMCNQVCFKVLGNDAALAFAMQAGQLELNVMMPLMAQTALESSEILTNALYSLRKLCIDGIEADARRCRMSAERTSAVSTALSPLLGYECSAKLTKEALRRGRPVLELARERKLVTPSQLKRLKRLFTPARLDRRLPHHGH